MNYNDLNDIQLWRLIASSDQLAFGYAFRIFSKDMFRYGQKLTSDKELIEDVIQDSFLELWNGREKITITSSVKFYLLTSFRRELVRRLTQWRKNKTVEEVSISPEDLLQTSYLEEMVDKQTLKESAGRIHKAIEELTDRQKEAVYLKYFMNLNYEEIAVMMQMQVPSVYNLIMKAMKTLKEELKSEDLYYKYK